MRKVLCLFLTYALLKNNLSSFLHGNFTNELSYTPISYTTHP